MRIGPAKQWGKMRDIDDEDKSTEEEGFCTSEFEENDSELLHYLEANASFVMAMQATGACSDACYM